MFRSVGRREFVLRGIEIKRVLDRWRLWGWMMTLRRRAVCVPMAEVMMHHLYVLVALSCRPVQRGAEKMISSSRDQIESSGACSREEISRHQIDHIIAFHDLFRREERQKTDRRQRDLSVFSIFQKDRHLDCIPHFRSCLSRSFLSNKTPMLLNVSMACFHKKKQKHQQQTINLHRVVYNYT